MWQKYQQENRKIGFWSILILITIQGCIGAQRHPDIWISESEGHSIRFLSHKNPGTKEEWVKNKTWYPDAILVNNGMLYVGSGCKDDCLNLGKSFILRIDSSNGELIDTFIKNENAKLKRPYGMAFGADGYFYVASFLSDEILRYNSNGKYSGVFAKTDSTENGCNGPNGLWADKKGNLFVTTEGSLVRNGKADFSDGFPSQLLKYDLTKGNFTILGSFAYPINLIGIDQKSRNKFLVSDYFAGDLMLIEMRTGEITDKIPSPANKGDYTGHLAVRNRKSFYLTGGKMGVKESGILWYGQKKKGKWEFEKIDSGLKRPIGLAIKK